MCESKQLSLTLIVAATRSNAIGRESSLPWRLSKEMAYFARITKGEPESTTGSSGSGSGKNVVIMGRKSWEGIPKKFRPLAERVNVVVTRQKDYDLEDSPSIYVANSLESAIDVIHSTTRLPEETESNSSSTATRNRTFLIGGAQLYNQTLKELPSPSSSSSSNYSIDRVLLTRIFTDYSNCDTFLYPFTEEPQNWRKASLQEFREWAGWEVPGGVQSEKDRAYKGEGGDKIVEYEFEMWVRA
ncbi:hypothetical protein JCM5350_003754 [Sporobolomyces pararoseus]